MFRKALLVGAFAFVVALVALAVLRPSSQPQQQSYNQTTDEKPHYDSAQNQPSKSFWERLSIIWARTWIDPIAFYTLVLACFSAALVFVAALQIWLLIRAERLSTQGVAAANVSARIADESLKTLQRAFVFAGESKILSHFDTPTKKVWWSYHIIWENSGNTPTRDLLINVNHWLDAKPLPDDWDFPSKGISTPTLIRPHGTIEGSSVHIDGDDLAKVQAGQLQLYIWGWAKYSDLFKIKHITRFCYKIAVLGDATKAWSQENIVEFRGILHPRFNCADEECKERGYPENWVPRQVE